MFISAGRLLGVSKTYNTGPQLDPFWNQVVLVMNMDSATFPDVKGHPVTVNNVTLAGGGSAGDFNGTSTSFLSLADSPDWNWGSGDVCFELDFAIDSFPDAGAIGMLGQWGSTFLFYFTASGFIFFANGSTAIINLSTMNWVLGQRYKVAVQRIGDTFKAYVDGVEVASNSVAPGYTFNDGAQNLIIGKNGDNDRNWMDGLIYGIRITKAARITGNYTPPNTFPTGIEPNWGGAWDPALTMGGGSNLINGDMTANIGGNGVTRGTNTYSTGQHAVEMRVESYSNTLGPIMGFNIDASSTYAAPFYGIFMVNTGQYQLITNGTFGATQNFPAPYVLGTDEIDFVFDIDAGQLTLYLNRVQIPGAVFTGIPANTWRPVAASPGGAYGATVTIVSS